MRWPWSRRRRGKAAVVSAQSRTFRPGSWADVAYPPAEQPTVRLIPASESSSRIRLGFADGTSLDVEESSPESAALQGVARDLLKWL